MSDFVKIAFNLDRVAGGKYAGRQLVFTNGVHQARAQAKEREIEAQAVEWDLVNDVVVPRVVKRKLTIAVVEEEVIVKEGYTEVRDGAGAIMGYLKTEDGGSLPTAAELVAMRDEVRALPERVSPEEQRIKELEARVALLSGASAPPPAKP